MASWTAPTTYATGNTLTVTAWNAVANNETFLYQAPYGLAYATGTTVCGSGGSTGIALAGLTTSSANPFTLATNQLSTPLAGSYIVTGTVGFNNSTLTGIQTWIQHNGSIIVGNDAYPTVSVSCVSICSASDTLQLTVYNGSGGSLTAQSGSNTTLLHAIFVGST